MLDVRLTKKKHGLGLRMLSVNYCHGPSLLTWIEMRRLTFDVGKQFFVRIEGLVAMNTFLLLTYLLVSINQQARNLINLNVYHWIIMTLQLAAFAPRTLKSLWHAASINEFTKQQIAKLMEKRYLLEHMLINDSLLMS
jgi:hypothetical protein